MQTAKGNRPSFVKAGAPGTARNAITFYGAVRNYVAVVEKGQFGRYKGRIAKSTAPVLLPMLESEAAFKSSKAAAKGQIWNR